jgi:hypothetical protein
MATEFPPLKNDLLLRAAKGMISGFCLLYLIEQVLQVKRPIARRYGLCGKLDAICLVRSNLSRTERLVFNALSH